VSIVYLIVAAVCIWRLVCTVELIFCVHSRE